MKFRYSAVVPVFNEADSIEAFCRRALTELPPDGEILICYDMPEDTTLAALEKIPANCKPANIRLVHNTLGRGVRYAIEAGMRYARSPVVLVLMADLSDELHRAEELIRQIESGAAVACGSRYMRGGRQIGGPLIKRTLSRLAGVSLYHLAKLPTRDATNSFKAYRKSFLDQQQIESKAGFCLGMELTLKAHFSGGQVCEVPSIWIDRAAGESRFQLRKWLPLYLYWYCWGLRRAWIAG